MGYIYKIINKVNGNIYVGSAISFEKRKYYHTYDLKNNKHHSIILQNSWNKYGEDTEFEIIEEVNKEDLLIREQYYIDFLNPKFNIAKIAGSPIGVKHTKEARANMSKSHIGIKPTKEALAKRSLKQGGENHWTFGKERIETTKEKISKVLKENYKSGYEHPFKGKKHKDDTKEKISKKLMIPIEQYDKEGNFMKEWDGAIKVEKELGFHASNITACCKGKTKTSNNYVWKYKNNKK